MGTVSTNSASILNQAGLRVGLLTALSAVKREEVKPGRMLGLSIKID